MNQTFFARSIAAAAMVGMLGVATPVLAQSTTGTSGQPTGTTGTTAPPASGPTTPNTNQKTPISNTGQPETQCLQDTAHNNSANSPRSSGGSQPIESTGSASNAPSGPTNAPDSQGDCGANGSTTTSKSGGGLINRSTQPMNNSGTSGSSTNSGTMNSGSQMNNNSDMSPTAGSTMQNTLRDNPNGPNWLQKFNRPGVAASNGKRSKYRTNKLGTSQPPKG